MLGLHEQIGVGPHLIGGGDTLGPDPLRLAVGILVDRLRFGVGGGKRVRCLALAIGEHALGFRAHLLGLGRGIVAEAFAVFHGGVAQRRHLGFGTASQFGHLGIDRLAKRGDVAFGGLPVVRGIGDRCFADLLGLEPAVLAQLERLSLGRRPQLIGPCLAVGEDVVGPLTQVVRLGLGLSHESLGLGTGRGSEVLGVGLGGGSPAFGFGFGGREKGLSFEPGVDQEVFGLGASVRDHRVGLGPGREEGGLGFGGHPFGITAGVSEQLLGFGLSVGPELGGRVVPDTQQLRYPFTDRTEPVGFDVGPATLAASASGAASGPR